MLPRTLPKEVDTVIVGNGPSALILSFILSGNIPYYNPAKPHPDPILQKKILRSPSLLKLNVRELTAHFAASRLSYSTQALPINALLDTLIRPLADTDPGEYDSCVEWRYEEDRRVTHLVLGNTTQPGGQWADDAASAGSTIGTLSYAEMLSLPGYTIEQHFSKIRQHPPAECSRPTRREVAEYLAAYPKAVNIEDFIFTHVNVSEVSRVERGFHIGSHGLYCKHLVLASGVFSNLIPPPTYLRPLATACQLKRRTDLPILVVGSGFTAADVILTSAPGTKIIHVFKWLSDRPSPLQACHPRAYPEYAGVYRQMKVAAKGMLGMQAVFSPLRHKKTNPFFEQRGWERDYEGFPNVSITNVVLLDDKALVTLETNDGRIFRREVANLEYVVGRRGSLKYLDTRLMMQVLDGSEAHATGAHEISSRTLRSKVEENLEVAPSVFVIGSLTGDSLIRFAFGGCIFAASEIIKQVGDRSEEVPIDAQSGVANPDMERSPHPLQWFDTTNDHIITKGHSGLEMEQKENHSGSVDLEMAKSELWLSPGWTLEVS
jgi:hypothetical protein